MLDTLVKVTTQIVRNKHPCFLSLQKKKKYLIGRVRVKEDIMFPYIIRIIDQILKEFCYYQSFLYKISVLHKLKFKKIKMNFTNL